MNTSILNTENQEFINENLNSDIASLLLKGTPNHLVDIKTLIGQIEAKKKCKKKLPSWFNAQNIYYPNKLNIEQTSSEATAKYKSTLFSGESIIDLTGGFGVDCYYFAKQFKNVTHCEINDALSQIVIHNYKQLGVKNIDCINTDGIEALKELNNNFDCIYLDPSRRDDIKGKVFLLKDCLPNAPQFLDLFFKYTKTVLIKTSPLIDISIGISELKNVKSIHCVAVNNEVKELLWLLHLDYNGDIDIKTVNITKKDTRQEFVFDLKEENKAKVNYSKPLAYLYEPNTAILKSGAFAIIAEKLNVYKLHKHSHLYTSSELIDFPGRSFKIEKTISYNKKAFKKEMNLNKANVTVRNFSESVQQIRKKLSLKDGGNNYLFFTTTVSDNKNIILCSKV